MTPATEQQPDQQPAPQANPGPGSRVWADEALANPHADAEKPTKVRSMFAAIAGSYDLNNRVHSLGLDQSWRKYAVKAARVKEGDTVADIACGTGDLTEMFARRSPAAEIIGLDFTPEMLDIARDKQATRSDQIKSRIRYEQGDAQNLPLDDNSADVLSIAFGIRNVQDPAAAFREFARVLKPGGRLVVLEFDTPRFPPVRWANSFYSGWLMPRTATLLSGDRSGAYRYLPKSVESFLTRGELVGTINEAGFDQIRVKSLTFGICACYRAILPSP